MRSLLAVGAIERPAGREAAPTTSTPRYRIALYAAQTIYVPDKDYVPSEPSTPPANVQCSPSQSQNDEGAADAEDKSDSSGMLNFTYPVRSFFLSLRNPSRELRENYLWRRNEFESGWHVSAIKKMLSCPSTFLALQVQFQVYKSFWRALS